MKTRYILGLLLLATMVVHSFVVAGERGHTSTAARSELKRLRAENAMLRVQILSLRKENKALRKKIKSLKAPTTQPTTQPTTKPAPGKVVAKEIEIYAKSLKELQRKIESRKRHKGSRASRQMDAVEWIQLHLVDEKQRVVLDGVKLDPQITYRGVYYIVRKPPFSVGIFPKSEILLSFEKGEKVTRRRKITVRGTITRVGASGVGGGRKILIFITECKVVSE